MSNKSSNLMSSAQKGYGKVVYWDEQYTNNKGTFDWYQRYDGLKQIILEHTTRDSKLRSLLAALSDEMYTDANITDITNIDISSKCIANMEARYSNKEGMKWLTMDILDPLRFAEESFDFVIAKATLDAVLCGSGSTKNVTTMFKNISRLMAPGGKFMVVSFGAPESRCECFDLPQYNWDVKVMAVAKPCAEAVSLEKLAETDKLDREKVHWVYIMEKKK